jgi:hypothetical protein
VQGVWISKRASDNRATCQSLHKDRYGLLRRRETTYRIRPISPDNSTLIFPPPLAPGMSRNWWHLMAINARANLPGAATPEFVPRRRAAPR